MKKYFKFLGGVICATIILGSTGFIFAQTANDGATNPVLGQVQSTIKEKAQQQLEKINELRTAAQEKGKVKAEKEYAKVDQIKDNLKKEAATKIIEQLKRTNAVWTDHFTNVLNQLEAVLAKIQTRADKVANNGGDITAVTTAITTAKTAIATARTAVATQAQKTYTIDTTKLTTTTAVTTTTGQGQLIKNFRNQFKAQHEQLKTDLTNIRDGVMREARKAVQDIVHVLSGIPNVDKEPKNNNQ